MNKTIKFVKLLMKLAILFYDRNLQEKQIKKHVSPSSFDVSCCYFQWSSSRTVKSDGAKLYVI